MRAIANGIAINYAVEGDGEPVTLIHALGVDLSMWAPQVPALRDQFCVLRYDVRGHGRTDCPPGPYSLDLFAEDLSALLQALGISSTHLVGLSMGGMIAQAFALNYPDQVRSLVLCCTVSEYRVEARRMFEQRARTAEERGLEPLVDPTLERWFTPAFRASHPEVTASIAQILRSTNPNGYAAACRAVAEIDLTERLQEIHKPSLVLAGALDPGATPEMARLIHEHLPGSDLRIIPNAAHLVNYEQTAMFNQLVIDFLNRATTASEEGKRRDAGD